MVAPPRIELGSDDYQSSVIPLYYGATKLYRSQIVKKLNKNQCLAVLLKDILHLSKLFVNPRNEKSGGFYLRLGLDQVVDDS